MQVSCTTREDFLNELSNRIAEEYDIHVRGIRENVNGSIVAYTKKQCLLIKRQDRNETHLIYATGIYEHLKGRGFKNIVKLYAKETGKYYTKLEGGFYIISDYMEDGRYGFDFRKNEDSVIKLLADFHRAAQGYSPPLGGKAKSDWGKWIEKYKKQYRALKRYKNQVIEKEEKSPFEELFMSTCNQYIERMEKAIDILKKDRYLDNVEDSMRKRQVCLDNIKASNFCKKKSNIYIKSLDKCKYDIVEKDIADLLQKIAECCPGVPDGRLAGLVELYHKKNPLRQNSVSLIKAFIIFPDEYEKVCSRHYKGKDKWSQELYVEKLKGAISLEENKSKLLRSLEGINLRLRGE